MLFSMWVILDGIARHIIQISFPVRYTQPVKLCQHHFNYRINLGLDCPIDVIVRTVIKVERAIVARQDIQCY